MKTEIDHYTATAKWLHWIMAVLIIVLLALGFYMSDLPRGPERTALIQLHKAIGTVALLLAVVRLAWRLGHRPPALPETMSWVLQKAAHGVHWSLYALMFLQPLTGWAMSSARGFPVSLAGFIPLPPLAPQNEGLAEVLKESHEIIGATLAFLVIGHVLMALKHHFIDRDTILLRMLPEKKHRP